MEKKSGNSRKTRTDAEVNVEIKERISVVDHGENVKHYRTMKQYTQDYMALEMNIPQQRYSDLERLSVIEERHIVQIAKILNLGTEWLTDIPILKGTTIYNQDGNGTNFQNTGDVNYTINNPVEEIKEAFNTSLNVIQNNFETIIEDKNKTIANLNANNSDLWDRLVSFMSSLNKK